MTISSDLRTWLGQELKARLPRSSFVNLLNSSDKVDDFVTPSSTSDAGIVELATEAEHETGTSETLAATPYGVTVIVRDALRDSVEAATGGHVTIIRDDLDNPSWMYVLPKFRVQDVNATLGTGVHPAFIVDGVEKSCIYIGVYQASLIGSLACSIPGADPQASVTFDVAKGYCTAKGTGWHLMSNWEWAAVALWCLANDYQPNGNTYYGRHHSDIHEMGIRQDGEAPGTASGDAYILTGSGPNSWRHNNAPNGIADLVGNVWEWVDGLKIDDGQIIMTEDNDYTADETTEWVSQSVYLDSDRTPSGSGTGNVVLNTSRTHETGTPDYCLNTWKDTTKDAAYSLLSSTIQERMMQACIDPTFDTTNPIGSIYMRNSDERMSLRGGYWLNTSGAGLFSLHLNNLRGASGTYAGFRPTFIG